VYFAAGSGITPVYAHLKYLRQQGFDQPIFLFYSNLSHSSVIFHDELEDLRLKFDGPLTVVHLISDEGKRLNNYVAENLVRQYLPNSFREAHYYLCGPFAYMRMARLTLLFMHIEETRIHKENFVLETVPRSTAVTNFPPQKLRVHFNAQWHDLVAGENQTILQAALQNGLHLPYSCGAGVCAACAVKCTSGQVTIVKNEVLTDAELKHGWVLTCTGYATCDNVEIDYQ
jgi:ferredoxin-NADP reductase